MEARRSRTTAQRTAEPRPTYADSSALVKLVIRESETDTLEGYRAGVELVTSRLAIVELLRAVRISRPEEERISEAKRLLASLALVSLSDGVLYRAAELASPQLRSLDAIHLATAERIGVDELLTYDLRLAAAAERLGLRVVSPG